MMSKLRESYVKKKKLESSGKKIVSSVRFANEKSFSFFRDQAAGERKENERKPKNNEGEAFISFYYVKIKVGKRRPV